MSNFEKNIRIEYSNETTESEIIYKLMDIEEDVYAENQRGHFKSISKRFCRNKEMFILVYDNDDIIGYLCYFPITKSLHDKIINTNEFFDDNIKSEDVMPFVKNNYIYLISIALYRKYHGLGIGKMMMDAFFNKLKDLNKKGYLICDVLASAVSLQGEKILKKCNFILLKDLSIEHGYKVMYINGDKIC